MRRLKVRKTQRCFFSTRKNSHFRHTKDQSWSWGEEGVGESCGSWRQFGSGGNQELEQMPAAPAGCVAE